ncbi:MAG TPA: hypothetical protein VK550_17265 [Polyangiaceae bacterium]|jgi:hypothetical protein|nr:hypothetical protein [Polyangiaceae bacterium]
MIALNVKVDTHRQHIEVPQGEFRVYREDDRYMVGRVPDGALLGFFRLELTTSGKVGVKSHCVGQLGLGTFDEARELLDVIGRAAFEHGIASA